MYCVTTSLFIISLPLGTSSARDRGLAKYYILISPLNPWRKENKKVLDLSDKDVSLYTEDVILSPKDVTLCVRRRNALVLFSCYADVEKCF